MHPGIAGEFATHLDRLALCIHRPTSRRPELGAALGHLDLPPQSIAVAAARFLAAGRVSLADVQSLMRYQHEDDVRALLEAHARRGLIAPVDDHDGVFVPSGELRDAASAVLALQAEEAERLWSGSIDLGALGVYARGHVAAAAEAPLTLDAFRRQAGVHHVLPETDSGQLLGYITELRYLRSDVHADCLAEEGLAGPTARTLHQLWKGFKPSEPVDRSLIERRMAEIGPQGPVATEIGTATCVLVEAATDSRFADVLRDVDEAQSTALLTGMRALDGEDPRPEEER